MSVILSATATSFLLLFELFFLTNANNANAVNKLDGFNIYKDLLRGKNEELIDNSELNENDGKYLAKMVYFYRTPVSEDSSTGDALSKRTVNKFKNMMLNKESLSAEPIDEDELAREVGRFYIPRAMPKRYPGAILSWAIPAANRARLNSSYRPPGITRPAA